MPRRFPAAAGVLVAIAALLIPASIASAVLSGANGRIAYVSGRGFTDAQSKIYLRVASGSFGLGGNTGPLSSSAGQHRHPTWSPNRTKIAYALGDASCNPTKCDIYVLDLTAPFPIAVNITNTPAVTEDRPAWSPDGTRIAYESAGDILVDPVEEGATLNLTESAAIEGKPAWTPDSTEIYYHTGDPTLANSLNIVKEPSGGGAVQNIATSPGENEFQPSLSPDGKQMCFTRGTGIGFNATADVIVSLANGGGQQDLSDDAVAGNYNCTWSPDGTQVAYVRGIFSTGDLVMERADDSSPFPVELETAPGVFDGNPDWAPDGRPVCQDSAVTTTVNKAVAIPLQCFDSGPFYERSFVREFVSEAPKNGTAGEVQQGDQEPSTVLYTPNPGFTGTDALGVGSFDEIAGFGAPQTVTIVVAAPQQPQPQPQQPKADLPRAPVISALTVKPSRWSVGTKAKVRWRLSEPAATRLVFQRMRSGKAFRNAASVTVASGKAGRNTFAVPKRIAKKLGPGGYRVSARATDSGGLKSPVVVSARFTVVASG
jgi:Tol biopolymer transport system component